MSAKKEVSASLTIPALADYVGVARLTVTGIASRMKFPAEDIEDIKVAVSEACANAVQYAYNGPDPNQNIDITFIQKEKFLEVKIEDKGRGFDQKKPPRRVLKDDDPHLGLGLTFMKSLMDDVKITSSDRGTAVVMKKNLA